MSINVLPELTLEKEYSMKTTKNRMQKSVLVVGFLATVLGLMGCEQEGSAEKAGQKIDRAVDNTGQKIEQTTEKAGQKAEAAKKSVEQQAEQTGQDIEQATEKAGDAMESAKESAVDKTVTTEEYIDDAAITLNVKTAILNDPVLKASQIEVTTDKGVVRLSGTVDSEQLVGRAIGLVNSQKNVKSVQNNLLIKTTAPSKQ